MTESADDHLLFINKRNKRRDHLGMMVLNTDVSSRHFIPVFNSQLKGLGPVRTDVYTVSLSHNYLQ